MISEGDIQGLWVRDWLKAPNFKDHTTRVFWAQVGSTYADVRIPLERPELGGASSLSDLNAAALHRLVQAEGFAGHVTLKGVTCTWHREINWHGASDTMDVGAINFDAQGRMIEAGILAEYTELWSHRRALKTRASQFYGGGYSGYLVSIGEEAVIGIGRANAPATNTLVNTLDEGKMPAGLSTLFDGVHVFGHWSGNSVVADLATNPFLEGHPVVTLNGDTLHWHRAGFDGTRSDQEMNIVTSSS